MRYHKHGFLLVGLLLITRLALAQPKASVEHYATENGLSHVAITYITKDKQGFMWFATWSGLNRFDGSHFTSYKSFPGDRSPLKNDRIDAVIDGDIDNLWLKAYDSQIYRFNKATGTLFSLNTVFPASLRPKLHFNNILAATDKHLWIRSPDSGLFYFPDAYKNPYRYAHYRTGVGPDRTILSNKVILFHTDREQNVWIGTNKGLSYLRKKGDGFGTPQQVIVNDELTAMAEGDRFLYVVSAGGKLYIVDKGTGRATIKQISNSKLNAALISRTRDVLYMANAAGELFECKLQDFATRKIAQASEEMRALFEDSKGNVWIEPGVSGVIRFSPVTGKLTNYHQQTDANARYTGNQYRVFEDKSGLVWISMKKGGFGYYDAKKDQVAYFYNDPNDPARKFSNSVANWYYDPAGVFWVTTNEHGLEKIVFQQNNFQQNRVEVQGHFKSDNDVRGLAVDRKGRQWVGTKGNKLYILQNGQKLNHPFVNEPAGGLGQVYAITPDSGGTVWLATKSNGLFKAEPVDRSETSYRFTHFGPEAGNANSINSDQIYTVLQDTRGRIWAGSFDEGLNLLVQDGRSVRFVHHDQLLKGLPPGAFRKIRKMALDAAGNIWVATTDGLLVIRDQSDQLPFRVKAYSKIPGDATSLGSNDIQYVYKDRHNSIWLGTSGGGISKTLGADPMHELKFQNYTSRDGLYNDYVVSLTADRDNNLWLASQNGLTRFDPVSGEFRTYDSSDGIPRTVFSESACINMPDGEIVFGTMDGLLSFDPEQLTDQRITGHIVFTDVQVNNRNIAQLNDSTLLSHQINDLSLLKLKYDQSTISFDYTVLDYRSGSKQNYLYRLAGFDSVWHSSRGFQHTTYTNLPPGHYTFEIKCVSTGLYTNTPYKSLAIEILPPPWRTWWAYLLYVAIAVAVFIMIRRTTITMLLLRQRIVVEQNIAELKTTFFTNISHELRTPLTLIINPITAIADTEKLSEKGREYISIVQKNANRMVRFINQLLDLRKVQSGRATLNYNQVELLAFIKDISIYFAEIANEKNISLTVNSNVDAITCNIDAEKMDIVLYNILANAYKFSPHNKHIGVDVTLENESARISIADEGGGVPVDKLAQLFDLFYEGDHHQQKGTGIGLALSKEMVELHGGRIWAENNDKGGLTVSISLAAIETVAADVVDTDQHTVGQESVLANGQATHEDIAKELVLLVEDNADLRSFLKLTVGEHYRVETAENGVQGLAMARELSPDIIISDIMMPEMDGITMLGHLKGDGNTSHIPVILLSAKQAIESRIQGLQYGADAYITKPFNNSFLQASIKNIVDRRKSYFRAMSDGGQVKEFSPSSVVVTPYDEAFLQKVIKIVEEGMPDPDFNIDTVAGSMNMSRSPFYKKIKALTGLAPVEFIREMRLKRARQYMDAGETVVSDIAYKVGFYNVKYFSTCFKEQFKRSPSDYLKEISVR